MYTQSAATSSSATSTATSLSSTKTATSTAAAATGGVEKLGGGGMVGYLAVAGAAGLGVVAVLL